MKKILVPLASGFEEIEALSIVDTLRRAGFLVTIASITSEKSVMGAHDVVVMADALLENAAIQDFDSIVLPGGMPGTSNLLESHTVLNLVHSYHKAGKIVAAICAAPWVLAEAGILKGKKATIYPGMEDKLGNDVKVSQERVVWDGLVGTSRGPGTALAFALSVAEKLGAVKEAQALAKGMLLDY